MSRLSPVSETSYILYLGDEISDEVSDRVQQTVARIRADLGSSVTDLVPSYTSILITIDPVGCDYPQLEARLNGILTQTDQSDQPKARPRQIEIPVYYGPEVALDLEEISAQTSLSPTEVIRLHSETTYRVYAIGFSPGFAYLGSTPQALRVNRKATPRLKVPQGSVALADNQTAIYPSSSPGGWQILGRTAQPLLDWSADRPTPFEVGDQVRFIPIERDEFLANGGVLDEF